LERLFLEMKILWLSNSQISGLDKGNTGTWLGALAKRLATLGEVVLGNVAMGNVREPTSLDCLPLHQWLVPATLSRSNGLPSRKAINGVLSIVESFSPDLIHIWGVEAWWGLLKARGYIKQPVLLEMQGSKGACSRVFAGGLSLKEQMNCRGIKEFILWRSIKSDRRKFVNWGRFEDEIIKSCNHVGTQTPWIEAWVRAVNYKCSTHHTDLMLRQEFYENVAWSPSINDPVLFCSAAYPVPYKGLHDAIRATALLSRRFPDIRLRIAGAQQKPGFRQDGYVRWLNRLSDELGVTARVDWLGPLTAEQIVRECQKCSVFIMSSHIENCCTAMQEALYLGVPTVSAYAGGVPALAHEEEAALYYSPGGEAMCAYQVERLLIDQDLAIRLSHNSRVVALKRNDPEKIVSNQLDIYRKVIAKESCG
jgi:glycosyltransferase involved in cell wall biosynthesis